jgi:hypothetical protein
MLCPYCLQNASDRESTCKNCKEPLPAMYVQRHGGPFTRSPAILSAVGFSGHGKTVYLAAMLHEMEKTLTRVWPKFFRQALDIDSVKTVQANLALLRQGDLPESTRRNFPRPSIHALIDMPYFGSRDLLIYDPPGEAFNTDEGMERFAHFVQRAKVVLFLVSLIDLDEPKADDLFRLLNTYVLGMAKMKAKPRDQHLVVAYTKADRLKTILNTHPAVLDHIASADHSALADPKKYLAQLRAVSLELEAFTECDLDARNFIHLTRKEFKSVNYCAVTALGQAPEAGHLATAIEPRRVLDPLLWVLEKS